MTRLRIMMLEELQRRNYSPGTIRCHLGTVADFARYFHRSPDQLRPQHIHEYQAYLFRERKLDASGVTLKPAALLLHQDAHSLPASAANMVGFLQVAVSNARRAPS